MPPSLPEKRPVSQQAATSLVNECRDYLDWEELRLSLILKHLREKAADGRSDPFKAVVSADAWDPSPGAIRRERLKELISAVCGIPPSHSAVTVLIGRLPPEDAATLQMRRDAVRGLAHAVHTAARGWMRHVALLELGVECTLQELTGGRSISVCYDDCGQISTSSPQPVINIRT